MWMSVPYEVPKPNGKALPYFDPSISLIQSGKGGGLSRALIIGVLPAKRGSLPETQRKAGFVALDDM